MKVLVTGFEPFGSWKRNPSGETALSLHGRSVRNGTIYGLTLPVSFRRATAPLIAAIDSLHPDVVLNLGQGALGGIRVERVAVNRGASPSGGDNDGYDPQGAPVEPDGPATYASTLPLAEILLRLADLECHVEPSDSAGTFLCNYIMYETLHYITTRDLPIRAGFIHASPLSEEISNPAGGAGMSLEQWIDFTEAVCSTVCNDATT